MHRLAVFAKVFVAFSASCTSLQAADTSSPQDLTAIVKAESPSELQTAYRSTFNPATHERVEELRAGKHDGIAMQAAWELVRRTISEEPQPKDGESPTINVSRRAAERFAGFVEGRLHVDLPSWWERKLTHAKTGRGDRDAIHFPASVKPAPYAKQERQMTSPPEISVRLTGDVLSLDDGQNTCEVPLKVFNKEVGNVNADGTCVSALFEPGRCFVALHESTQSGTFKICCVNTKTSGVIWTGSVWTGVGGGGSGTGHYQWVA